MTDLDLERLGDLWRQQPDPKELEELRRAAEKVRKRARWAQTVNLLAAVVVAGVVLTLVASSPRTDTVVIGAAAILLLLVSQIRQRRVWQIELRSLSGTTEQMLDQSIARLQTSVRQTRFTLIAMGPGLVAGYLVASSAERSVGTIVGSLSDEPMFRILWVGGAVAVISVVAVAMLAKIRRQQRELDRLETMREFYRDERASTGP